MNRIPIGHTKSLKNGFNRTDFDVLDHLFAMLIKILNLLIGVIDYFSVCNARLP